MRGVWWYQLHRHVLSALYRFAIQIPNAVWWELERRLLLVYLGNSHDSSQVHEMVISGLEAAGPSAAALEPLRRTAKASRDAVYAGDFVALGRTMIANTEAQRALHPALVSADAGPRHRHCAGVWGAGLEGKWGRR